MSFHQVTVACANQVGSTVLDLGAKVSFHVVNLGIDGRSAYQIALDNGFIGTEVQWLASLQGGAGNDLVNSFSWGDAFPTILGGLPINKALLKIEVVILTAFNTNSTLSIGTDFDNSQFAATSQIDLTTVGTYEINPNFVSASAVSIKAFLNLVVGNKTGNGLIFINVQE